MPAPIVVLDNSLHTRAAAMAARLGLPLCDAAALPPGCVAVLQFDGDRWQLRPADAGQSGPIEVDFCAGANAHRLQGGAEPIAKAVRGRSRDELSVLDATAGLGRDGFVLASRGFRVHMLERSPIVAALLDDGLERARRCGDARIAAIAGRMTLRAGDAVALLPGLQGAARPDVVYLDPMFPPSDKTARVKKEMRLLQQLLHDTADEEAELLAAARNSARLRVVVKRPRRAGPLAGARADYALEGTSVRFDVYLPQP